MSEPFIGEIRMFGGNFAPVGWAQCDGQLLAISQNEALFSLLGTIYGGDGRTTFGLPELRGRIPLHFGTGPGLSTRSIGLKSGAENVTLGVQETPSHTHELKVANIPGTADAPDFGSYLASSPNVRIFRPQPPTGPMSINTIGSSAGGGLAHSNVMPFQCVNFIIALFGTFPSRN